VLPSGCVTSGDLKPEQIRQLQRIVNRQQRFLNRLCQRLDRLSFEPTDPLYVAAHKALQGVHALSVITHYAVTRRGESKQ
jgi:hypothetical protein